MSSRYLIKAQAIESHDATSDSLHLSSDHKYYLELDSSQHQDGELFAVEGESASFWSYLKSRIKRILQPLKTAKGKSSFITFAVIYTFAAIVFIIKSIFKSPLERGWRLEVVRRVALQEDNPVPGVQPDLLFKYFARGWVLVIMRFIYFLPLFIIALFSGAKMFNLFKEVAFYLWDMFIGADQMSFLAFITLKVIPQAGIEIIIQLIVLSLYAVFVWPIYRLIMVQYALKLTSASSFLNIKTIKKSIEIFKRNATLVYGVYGFSLAIDALILILAKLIGLFSFGLLFFIIPTFHLLLRHWVKGYAYGYLGQKLLASGELSLEGSENAEVERHLV